MQLEVLRDFHSKLKVNGGGSEDREKERERNTPHNYKIRDKAISEYQVVSF